MIEEPKRLFDEPGISPSLREALSDARTEGPNPQEVGALLAALGPAADQPLPLSAGVTHPLLVKAALIVALGLGAGGAWYLAQRRTSEPARETRTPIAAALSATSPEIAPTAPSPATTIDLDEAANESAQKTRALPSASSTTGPSEATLLEEARQNLAKNPARSLALTEEHRRRFPKGALVQEREVIAIDALGRLGKADEAKRRSNAFSEKNPDSIHRRTVKELDK